MKINLIIFIKRGADFHFNADKISQSYLNNCTSHLNTSASGGNFRIRSGSPQRENKQLQVKSLSPQRTSTAQTNSTKYTQNATTTNFFQPIKTYKYNPNASTKLQKDNSMTQTNFFRPKVQVKRNSVENIVPTGTNVKKIKRQIYQKQNEDNQNFIQQSKTTEISIKKIAQILEEQAPITPNVEVLVNKYLIQQKTEEYSQQLQYQISNSQYQKQLSSNCHSPSSKKKKQQKQNEQNIVDPTQNQRSVQQNIFDHINKRQSYKIETNKTRDETQNEELKEQEYKENSSRNSGQLQQKQTGSESQSNKSQIESQTTVKTYTEIKSTIENNLEQNFEQNYCQSQEDSFSSQQQKKTKLSKNNDSNQKIQNSKNSSKTADFPAIRCHENNDSHHISQISQEKDSNAEKQNSNQNIIKTGIKVNQSKLNHHIAKSVGYEEKDHKWIKMEDNEMYLNQDNMECEEFEYQNGDKNTDYSKYNKNEGDDEDDEEIDDDEDEDDDEGEEEINEEEIDEYKQDEEINYQIDIEEECKMKFNFKNNNLQNFKQPNLIELMII